MNIDKSDLLEREIDYIFKKINVARNQTTNVGIDELKIKYSINKDIKKLFGLLKKHYRQTADSKKNEQWRNQIQKLLKEL